ncbi:MAG: hypothetical protein PHG48_07660 [Eubacteriales bacterium]|nr:hypothetical protein [Eubacteriales bacterium]
MAKKKKATWRKLFDEGERVTNYRGMRLVLVLKKAGVYGGGRVVCLYKVNDDLTREYINTVGWIEKDHGYASYMKPGPIVHGRLITMDEAEELAIKYVDDLLG